MAANQPTPGREILPAGIDVRKIRKPINEAFAAVPVELIGQGAATSKDGRRLSFSVVGEDAFYIRLDNKTTVNGVVRYGWKAVNQDRDSGNWSNCARAGNATTDDWATELNNANLTVGTSTRYPARVNPQSGRVTFFQGSTSGGGNVTASSTETVLMILGTYDDYKNCPNVPNSPPTTYTDYCNGTRGNELCVPAYAYAVYQRCGYVWNKIGDTRTYQVWANEMNGGSTAAWRRFVIPRWGGAMDPATGLPDPDAECMGVAFLASGASELTCSCPTWLGDVTCLVIKITWIAQPGSKPADCPQECWDDMAAYWGTTSTVLLEQFAGSGCQMTGTVGPFTVTGSFQDRPRTECYWGPDVYDPCDPCAAFGRFVVAINSTNCGSPSTAWVGRYVELSALRDLLCDCTTGPLTASGVIDDAGPCGDLVASITIECCTLPEDELIAYYAPDVEQVANGTTSSWGDQTASNADMAQTVAARLPSLTTVGGFGAFSFVNEATAANDDFMDSTALSLINGKPGATVFAVFEFDSSQTADGGIFGIYTGSPTFTTGVNLVMINDAGSMKPRFQYRREITDATSTVLSSVAMSNGTIHAVIGRVNFVNGSQAFKISVNGTETTGTAPSGAVYAFDSGKNRQAVAGAAVIGATGAPTAPCTLRLIECGAYGAYLDDTLKTQLQTYLHGKYGI